METDLPIDRWVDTENVAYSGLAKNFRFFYVTENPNKLFGQPNT